MSHDNLILHRSASGTVDRLSRLATGDRARLALGLAAAALGFAGMRRRGARALLLMLASSALYRAASGHDDFARVRSWIARLRAAPEAHPEAVIVAGEESFPASDPPAWTPTIGRV